MRNHITFALVLATVLLFANAGSAQDQAVIRSPICPIVSFNIWDNPLSTQICEVYFCGAVSEGVLLDGITSEMIGSVEDYTYIVYNFNGYLADAVCHSDDIEVFGERVQVALMDAPIDLSLIDNTFGIVCDWNPVPRIPVRVDPEREEYRDAAAEVLQELHLEAPDWYVFGEWFDNVYEPPLTEMDFEIREAIVIDLNGDSSEEVLLTVAFGEDRGGEYDHRECFLMLMTDTGNYCIDSGDLLGLYSGGINLLFPEVDLILDADGDGYMEFAVTSGCCMSHEFYYYSYRDGDLSRISMFESNKNDVRGLY